ncbi:n-acetylglutamate synthase [Terribacillus saccharophilus]|uniref:n-acetylglutamate synthase n=1 Tax=Terribacillus saccharophilus TaxID=361277 RepID=UPI003981957A
MNYHNLIFRAVTNTDNGETSSETTFHYQQEGQILTAAYSGGTILEGRLIGIVEEDGKLRFRYHHINDKYELRSGQCVSIPEILADGRVRLHERWQWMFDDDSVGESIVEQVKV